MSPVSWYLFPRCWMYDICPRKQINHFWWNAKPKESWCSSNHAAAYMCVYMCLFFQICPVRIFIFFHTLGIFTCRKARWGKFWMGSDAGLWLYMDNRKTTVRLVECSQSSKKSVWVWEKDGQRNTKYSLRVHCTLTSTTVCCAVQQWKLISDNVGALHSSQLNVDFFFHPCSRRCVDHLSANCWVVILLLTDTSLMADNGF